MKHLRLFALLCCAGQLAACGTAQPFVSEEPKNEQQQVIPNPVDSSYVLSNPNSTAETASLFSYLMNASGKALLFGHQHDTTQGITFSSTDSVKQSDTVSAVGDFPAIYGWDTLSIVDDRPEGNIDNHVRAAYARGGIVTISTHLPNPTTQASSWDTTQAVPYILPGARDHQKYVKQLDQIADWALAMKDDQGRSIPIILRVLHENTGSWFWWGAAFSTQDQYRNLYRFTVSYLRDVRKVNNLLFAYSPSDDFLGSEAIFMERYPGDAYVDVIGFDSYGPAMGSHEWRKQLVKNAATVARIAKARGKVPALTEVGLQPDDLAKGHKDPHWFTELYKALKSDPDARNIAYIMVWRNGAPDHYWVPVEKLNDGMIEDFRQFHAEPDVFFNRSLQHVYDRKVQVKAPAPQVFMMSPTELETISGTITLRARLEGIPNPDTVTFSMDNGQALQLKYDGQLYYQGELDTRALPDNHAVNGQLSVVDMNGNTLKYNTRFIVSNQPVKNNPETVDNFNSYYGLTEMLKQAYSPNGDPIAVSLDGTGGPDGKSAMLVEFSLDVKGYSGLTHAINGEDWSAYDGIRFWMDPDLHGQRMVVQITAGGKAWESYLILGENDQNMTAKDVNSQANTMPIPSITKAGWITLPFSAFRPAPWNQVSGDFRATNVSAFSLYMNALTADTRIKQASYKVADIQLYKKP